MDKFQSARRSAAEQSKIREELGVRLFEPAPEDFDPLKASADELRVYGYPPRPDAKIPANLHEFWEQMVSRSNSIIEPQFTVLRGRGDKPIRYGPPAPPRLPASTGWAGSTQYPALGDGVVFVMGRWTVPHILAVGPDLKSICACWVGIDGGFGGPNPRSPSILQAGTTQFSLFGTLQSWPWLSYSIYESFVWFEWYPASPWEVENLKVSPGDTMECWIVVESRTQALIYLRNVTTRVGTSWHQTAPVVDGPNGSVQLYVVGNSAEWVLEAPVDQDVYLGQFGDVYFDYCGAVTRNGAVLTGGTGVLSDLLAASAPPLAVTRAENQWLIKVTDP